MAKKILILTGGGAQHLAPFIKEAEELGLDLTTSSFSRLEYLSGGALSIDGVDLVSFDVIYIRVVGKRSEDAALVASYAKENGVRIVDKIYEMSRFIKLPLAKSVEAKVLSEAGIPIPKTYFSKLTNIKEKAGKLLGFPFVIKGTMGKQGNAVWLPKDEKELEGLIDELIYREKEGERFIAQEFIKASERRRIFVVGERAIAAIVRPMRWRKRFIQKVNNEFPEGRREPITKMDEKDEKLSVAASKALGIEIAGVDLIKEDGRGRQFIMEVNSAPRWDSIKKDTGVNVERKILEYLSL